MSLVGPGGLLNQLTKNVVGTVLDTDLTGHLGREHGQTPIVGMMRNCTRLRTVLTGFFAGFSTLLILMEPSCL